MRNNLKNAGLMLRDWFILKKASHSHVFVLISASPLTLCWMAKSEFLIKIYLNQCWHLEEFHYLWNQCIMGGKAIFWALLRFSFGNLISGGDFNLRCSFCHKESEPSSSGRPLGSRILKRMLGPRELRALFDWRVSYTVTFLCILNPVSSTTADLRTTIEQWVRGGGTACPCSFSPFLVSSKQQRFLHFAHIA